jgi:hypothetical protein
VVGPYKKESYSRQGDQDVGCDHEEKHWVDWLIAC